MPISNLSISCGYYYLSCSVPILLNSSVTPPTPPSSIYSNSTGSDRTLGKALADKTVGDKANEMWCCRTMLRLDNLS